MSALCLNVEPILGKDLPEVAMEMQRLSDQLNINVSLDYNGVALLAVPFSRYENIVLQYREDFLLVLKTYPS